MPTGAAQRATARAARPWGRQRRNGGRLWRERRTMGWRERQQPECRCCSIYCGFHYPPVQITQLSISLVCKTT